MPYELHIDHDLRLVIGTVWGDVTEADVYGYHHDPVWSTPEYAGYSELMDTTNAQKTTFQLANSLPHLADSAARRDLPGELAGYVTIVAPDDYFFGLSRMYQALREVHPRSQKKVGVFRTREEALAWLASVRSAEKSRPPVTGCD
jgi:hypothetical protein